MTPPVIETARLRLRAHELRDYDRCCEMWGDAAVTRFIGGRTSTRQQCWSRILTYRGMWPLLGYGYWAVEEKSSGLYAGEAGFADFKRDIVPEMQNVPELGFAFMSAVHGIGYGTEAVRAIVAWGDEHLPLKRTVCIVSAANEASLRIVQGCGYHAFADDGGKEDRALYLERTL